MTIVTDFILIVRSHQCEFMRLFSNTSGDVRMLTQSWDFCWCALFCSYYSWIDLEMRLRTNVAGVNMYDYWLADCSINWTWITHLFLFWIGHLSFTSLSKSSPKHFFDSISKIAKAIHCYLKLWAQFRTIETAERTLRANGLEPLSHALDATTKRYTLVCLWIGSYSTD